MARILATYRGKGTSSRHTTYVVITDEDYAAGEKPIPSGHQGGRLVYKKLSNLSEVQADGLKLSQQLSAQRKRNKASKNN